MSKGKKTLKTKVVYRERKPTYDKEKTKKELQELQQKRQQIREEVEKSKEGKKGFSKFAASLGGLTRKAAINKAISEKRRALGIQERTEKTKAQIQFLKQQTELEQEKAKLREARQKTAVDFGSIFETPKAIKEEDIFK